MGDYQKYSKEDLIKKVLELESLLDAMKAEKNDAELLNFPWIGNLGNWYWSLIENSVIFNDQKVLVLGYQKSEIPEKIGFEFFTEKLHPDDYDHVMNNMRSHLAGMTPVYETTYRIQTKDGGWKWFYDRGKVTRRDSKGKAELVVGIVFDVTEQKHMEQLLAQQNEQLLEMSSVDFLTRVYNRRVLYEKLEYEISKTERYKDPFCIMMIDIDYFKKINDTYGHLTGDMILTQTAENITKNLRKTDIFGRYGGEEFMAILPKIKKEEAVVVAEKIRAMIEDFSFNEDIRITISIGVAEYQPGMSADEIINQADTRLYSAKKNGRNRVET